MEKVCEFLYKLKVLDIIISLIVILLGTCICVFLCILNGEKNKYRGDNCESSKRRNDKRI